MQIEKWYNDIIRVECKRIEADDCTINFMPAHSNGMGPETPDGETALIIGENYYILNGDWTIAYLELLPAGLEACKAFFAMKYPQFGSSWSNLP